MKAWPLLRLPHALAAAFCAGLVLSLGMRVAGLTAVGAAALALGLASVGLTPSRHGALFVAVGLLAAGWWWGSGRLETLGASVLTRFMGSSALMQLEVTGPARHSLYATRVPVRVRTVDHEPVGEASQLELPATVRAPPQGAILDLVARVAAPDQPTASSSFDEASYLARRGIHAVLRADRYRIDRPKRRARWCRRPYPRLPCRRDRARPRG